MLTAWLRGSSAAGYYRKRNLDAERSHTIPEVNSRPGKSTAGSNFHNYLLQQGHKDWQNMTTLSSG